MTASVYILRCSDGSYYVGSARGKSLDARVAAHNQGVYAGAYTASPRPVVLVWSEFFDRIEDAIAAERKIKGWRRQKKDALIRGEYERLPGLSKRGRNG